MAAGSGSRLGADRPKAFVEVAGRPMIEWSLDALRAAGIEEIVVALPEGASAPAGLHRRARRRDPLGVGARRAGRRGRRMRSWSTTRRGRWSSPSCSGARWRRWRDADCAIAAAPMTDTVKEAVDGVVTATLDRSRLWAVQTPQAFRRAALEAALAVDDAILARATDDAWLVERAGGSVRVVESSPANFKVTTPHDLRVADMILRERC